MKQLSKSIRYAYWNTIKDINPLFVEAQYAVRGQVPSMAATIQEEINAGKKYPFDSITELNIGNPQTFGQKPITFNRSVLASMLDPNILKYQSGDVQRRVKFYNDKIGFQVGAYSQSPGYPVIREAVANFIQKRDATKNRPSINDIILTDGASSGITLMFNLLLKDKNDGVMIPIPQYPLYSAVIAQCGAHQIPYYLVEDKNWSAEQKQLEEQYSKAKRNGINPRILVCINPGNPTGQVFDKQSIVEMIKFAADKKITIFADEVYQENIYDPKKKFISFRKVANELNLDVEIYSFHSISKGITGECGLRGGYMEITSKIDSEVHFQIHKSKTIMLCSNTVGQLMTGLMVTPPTTDEGCSEPTVEQYNEECKALFTSLQRRAGIVTQYLNQTKGVSCQPIEGAMYAFPRIFLTDKFVQHAKKLGYEPDVLYCLDLLKETGLVVVPGSGFLQYPGTYHFRMTILILPEEKLLAKMKIFQQWHESYIAKFQ
ncbi:unnamed protein product (macronuclear) [Paramecium tetraurelia]|uniref:Aminotransferase class I/classII large domain-containing protein n=1 Tax=Paramecium tetraurelia TaxID=5888 RepID=A0E2A1_PARTE|nr:uncharacterized protein GSPATT00022590001 [Paramecium tetraurelia]CAK89418.1 unnamed protein product [Paramecium tetraurelia]|eukprot:XP_001456815.1 hypothetical protein (macronuclear) [Paramecium tetraurelia strain d4-2]